MELTISQLYSDYENKGIVRIVKSGQLQEPRKEQPYDQE